MFREIVLEISNIISMESSTINFVDILKTCVANFKKCTHGNFSEYVSGNFQYNYLGVSQCFSYGKNRNLYDWKYHEDYVDNSDLNWMHISDVHYL